MTSLVGAGPRVGLAVRSRAPATGWGPFPVVLLATSVGLTLVALGSNGARTAAWWGEPLFWAGLAVIFGSVVFRILSRGVSRGELIALVALVGVALFLTKHLGNPIAFERYDELLHQRTLDDLVSSGRLFTANPLLPISPYYPGLEIATAAIVQTTGVSYVTAGAIVLVVGRLLLVLALFLLYESVSQSARIGAIGSIVYMTHQNFVQFNAAFAYESLAIPLGAGLIFLVVRQGRAPLRLRTYAALVALIGLGIAATHHITSFALVAFLVLWAGSSMLFARGRASERHVLIAASIFTLIVALWTQRTGSLLGEYLAPVIENAVSGVIGIVTGAGAARDLFVSRGGVQQPLWSQAFGTIAPLLILVALPVGLIRVVRLVRRGAGSIAVAPALLLSLVALAYPASLAFRLSAVGAQTSGRSSEFLFLGVAFVGAMAVDPIIARTRYPVIVAIAGAALAVTLLIGGVILGTPEWSRLPQPYAPGADARSIDEHALSVRDWANAHLAPAARLSGDRMTRSLIGASGGHDIVSQTSSGFPIWSLFFSTDVNGRPLQIIHEANVQHIVVDRRLAGATPYTRYIEPGEQYRIQTGPMRIEAIRKWEVIPWVSREYDDGDIYVYDLTGAPDAP